MKVYPSKKFRPKSRLSATQNYVLLLNLFATLLLSFGAWAKDGIYTGSFDPPTDAHVAIIRHAIEEEKVDKLHVIINRLGTKDYNASASERAELLRLSLGRYSEFVEIVPEPWIGKHKYMDALRSKSIDRVPHFIGDDSFATLPSAERQNEKAEWFVIGRNEEKTVVPKTEHVHLLEINDLKSISSTRVREALTTDTDVVPGLHPDAQKKIRANGLYTALPDEFLSLQSELHQAAYNQFISEMRLKLNDPTIGVSHSPPFIKNQSHLAWSEQFIRWNVQSKKFGKFTLEVFAREIESLIVSTFRDTEYAKIPYLTQYRTLIQGKGGKSGVQRESTSARTTTIEIPDYSSFKNSTLNIEKYGEDRLPSALVRFLDKDSEVFFHLGSNEDALKFHHEQGFTQQFEVSTAKAQNHRVLSIVVRPSTGEKRLVLSKIRGKNRLAHVQYQVSSMMGKDGPKKGILVRHKTAWPLFKPAITGSIPTLGPKDTVIIGFKNAIWRHLQSKGKDWKKVLFSQEGIWIDIYIRESSGERIFNSKAPYGDEINELLDYFYKKGARNFLYLGTAGSLSAGLKSGSVIVPNSYELKAGSIYRFENNLRTILGRSAVRNEKHGSIDSIIRETPEVLESMQKRGISSIDVEASHYANYFADKLDARAGLALFVSDEPLAGHTLDQHNATSGVVDRAFESVADQVIPAEGYVRPLDSLFARRRFTPTQVSQMIAETSDRHIIAIFEIAKKHGVEICTWGGTTRALLSKQPVSTDYDFAVDVSKGRVDEFRSELQAYGGVNQIKTDVVFKFDPRSSYAPGELFAVTKGGDLSINRIGIFRSGDVFDPVAGLADWNKKILRFAVSEPGFRPGLGSIARSLRFVGRYPDFEVDSSTIQLFKEILTEDYALGSDSLVRLAEFRSALERHYSKHILEINSSMLSKEYEAWRLLVRGQQLKTAYADTVVGKHWLKNRRLPRGSNWLDIWKNESKTTNQLIAPSQMRKFFDEIGFSRIMKVAGFKSQSDRCLDLLRKIVE